MKNWADVMTVSLPPIKLHSIMKKNHIKEGSPNPIDKENAGKRDSVMMKQRFAWNEESRGVTAVQSMLMKKIQEGNADGKM